MNAQKYEDLLEKLESELRKVDINDQTVFRKDLVSCHVSIVIMKYFKDIKNYVP